MSESFVFISPGVKFRVIDLTNRSTIISRSSTTKISSGDGNTNNSELPHDSMLQWITGVMYNMNVLMYDYKIWTNN